MRAAGLLLVATVGKFNQRDKEKGDRKIFRTQLDTPINRSGTCSRRAAMKTAAGRQLIVVYDEGHNLSNQQTQLLMELEPDALIAASATMRVPQALAFTIERLRREKGWTDDELVTSVKSSKVVESGLVKKHILLGGYMTPMESAVDDLLAAMKEAEEAAVALGLFLPAEGHLRQQYQCRGRRHHQGRYGAAIPRAPGAANSNLASSR